MRVTRLHDRQVVRVCMFLVVLRGHLGSNHSEGGHSFRVVRQFVEFFASFGHFSRCPVGHQLPSGWWQRSIRGPRPPFLRARHSATSVDSSGTVVCLLRCAARQRLADFPGFGV